MHRTLTGNQFLAADVDTDDDVDSDDATAIAKKGIGLPTGIPGFAQLTPSPQPSPWEGEGGRRPGEGLWLALLPVLLVRLRSRRMVALLLAVGLLGTLAACTEFAGLPPPSGPAVFLTSTSMPSGFVVQASSIDNAAGELRFSLVKPTAGGVSSGPVLRLAISASGAPRSVMTLSWKGSAQAPVVIGGDTNTEILGVSFGDGQVKVR